MTPQSPSSDQKSDIDPSKDKALKAADDLDEGPGGAAARARGAAAPVSAPGEILFHLRWKNPGLTLSNAARYTQLPAGFVNANIRQGVLEVVREMLQSKVDTMAFADIVSVDAPIDVVVTADMSRSGQVPEPMFAYSIGLTSLDRALSTSKGKPRKIADGVWQIGTQDKWGEPCAVSAAAGKTPARLVCGERTRHVEALAAFMARNVAVLPDPPSDLRAELKLRGLLRKYGRKWTNQARGLPVIAEEFKLNIPAFDVALMEAADALAAEAGALIADADSMLIDVGLDPQAGASVKMQLKFAGKRSWFVNSVVDGAHLSGPAPPIFWQVPKTSEMISYGYSADAARYAPLLKTFRTLLEGYLQDEKVGTAADRKALAKLLRFPLGKKHAASVGANGHFPGATASKKKPKTFLNDLINATVGWHLVGYEAGPTKMRAYLNELVKVYNRPTLQRLMKKELGSDAKFLPKIKVVPAPRNLGGGGMAIEIIAPNLEDPLDSMGPTAPGGPPAKPKTVDVKAYVMLMGDSGRTWLGFAADKTALAKLMATIKGAAPGPNSLSGRSDLGRFKTESHNAGTVTSLEGLLGAVKPAMWALMSAAPSGVSGPGQQILNTVGRMPHKGKTPIVAFVDVSSGRRPKASFSMNVPRESLEDVGFLVTNVIKIVQQNP